MKLDVTTVSFTGVLRMEAHEGLPWPCALLSVPDAWRALFICLLRLISWEFGCVRLQVYLWF